LLFGAKPQSLLRLQLLLAQRFPAPTVYLLLKSHSHFQVWWISHEKAQKAQGQNLNWFSFVLSALFRG
jgi:hypothetical protein